MTALMAVLWEEAFGTEFNVGQLDRVGLKQCALGVGSSVTVAESAVSTTASAQPTNRLLGVHFAQNLEFQQPEHLIRAVRDPVWRSALQYLHFAIIHLHGKRHPAAGDLKIIFAERNHDVIMPVLIEPAGLPCGYLYLEHPHAIIFQNGVKEVVRFHIYWTICRTAAAGWMMNVQLTPWNLSRGSKA